MPDFDADTDELAGEPASETVGGTAVGTETPSSAPHASAHAPMAGPMPDPMPELIAETLPPEIMGTGILLAEGAAEERAALGAPPLTVAPENPLRRLWMLALLSLLMAFSAISTDLYLPALPSMGRALSASAGAMEWTISAFLIGLSLGQVVWGPVGDRWGRRGPVALGLLFFTAGSIGCALAPDVPTLIVCRAIQAFGASSGVVLSRAMVRDLYEGAHGAKMLSTLIIAMAAAPLLGPFLGSAILAHAGWRSIFWVLTFVGIGTLGLLFTLPETHPLEKRQHVTLGNALVLYGKLLRHRRLLGYAGAGAFYYCGMFAYIAGSPFAYIGYYHVAQQHFGFLFGAGIIGIMGTNFLNARMVGKLGYDRLLGLGTLGGAIAGCVAAFVAATGIGGLWGLVAALLGFVACTGLIVANSITGALQDYPRQAGAVSALVGGLQYGSGIIGSGLTGLLADGTPWPMGAVLGVAGVGSFLCARFLARPPRISSPS